MVMSPKVGFGYDVHRFCEGDHIMLGGEKIPHSQGIDAHSDGDVLLHAICDAILGAAGAGDIGQHFSDQDSRFENIDSRILLQNVMRKAGGEFVVGNVDCTVVLERPRLATHVRAMEANIGELLEIPADHVNVKATTHEGMGFAGRGEGIAAYAVVLLAPRTPADT